MYYTDVDGDGFGAGDQSEDCAHPSLHQAVLGGDCDDNDPDVHALTPLYADADQDGYSDSLTAENVCIGVSPPLTHSYDLNPAPYISFAAVEIVDEKQGYPGEDWKYEDDAIFRDGHGAKAHNFDSLEPSHALIMTNFGFEIPDNAQINGLRAHLVRRVSSGDEAFDSLIALQYQGASVGTNHARADLWPEEYTDQAYGSSEDLWGLDLTPQMLNDPSFGLVLVVYLGGEIVASAEAYVDNAWIEVFTSPGLQDCDAGNVNLAGTSIMRVDADGDGYGSETGQVSMCVGQSMPMDYALNAFVDCYDSNDEVYSGATAYHTGDRGDGSFDYNCDGIETKQTIYRHTGCTWDSNTSTCISTGSAAISAQACGQDNIVQKCSGTWTSCGLHDVTIATACR